MEFIKKKITNFSVELQSSVNFINKAFLGYWRLKHIHVPGENMGSGVFIPNGMMMFTYNLHVMVKNHEFYQVRNILQLHN